MTGPFQQVADTSRLIHDAFVLWARGLLGESGLEAVEVYGQFPPDGATSNHIVLFPYALGPDPKLVQTSAGISLSEVVTRRERRQEPPPGMERIPEPWLRLAQALVEVTRELARGEVQPRLEALPTTLADWYRAESSEDLPWVSRSEANQRARLPLLWWHPGFVLGVRYVAVAADVGRGSYDRTSTGAPMSLPALSVLAAGLHHRRTLRISAPPLTVPQGLKSWIAALPDSGNARLSALIREAEGEQCCEVALAPAQDLTTQEFALLMQALQRPLQSALNIQMRFRLADVVEFCPESAILPSMRGAQGVPGW